MLLLIKSDHVILPACRISTRIEKKIVLVVSENKLSVDF